MPPNPARRGCGKARCPNICWHRLALVGFDLVCCRFFVSLLFDTAFHGELTGNLAVSTYVSSWLRCFPIASSLTGRIREVLRYVPIPTAHARIRRPCQPNTCKSCFACVLILDPDSFNTACLGRCVTHWTRHIYSLPCHQPDAPWQPRVPIAYGRDLNLPPKRHHIIGDPSMA